MLDHTKNLREDLRYTSFLEAITKILDVPLGTMYSLKSECKSCGKNKTKQVQDNGSCEDIILKLANIEERIYQGEAVASRMYLMAEFMARAIKNIRRFGRIIQDSLFLINLFETVPNDIGKNILAMNIQGIGWEATEFRIDVEPETFFEIFDSYPNSVIGISLLTKTSNELNLLKRETEDKKSNVVFLKRPANGGGIFANIGAGFYSSASENTIRLVKDILA